MVKNNFVIIYILQIGCTKRNKASPFRKDEAPKSHKWYPFDKWIQYSITESQDISFHTFSFIEPKKFINMD